MSGASNAISGMKLLFSMVTSIFRAEHAAWQWPSETGHDVGGGLPRSRRSQLRHGLTLHQPSHAEIVNRFFNPPLKPGACSDSGLR